MHQNSKEDIEKFKIFESHLHMYEAKYNINQKNDVIASQKSNKINYKKTCPYCFSKGGLMGDDESLFECQTNNSHIWSIHDCKKLSTFLGWLPHKEPNGNDSDDDINPDYTSSYVKNHKRYCVTYNPDEWQDGSVFLWNCQHCKEEYVTMMCG